MDLRDIEARIMRVELPQESYATYRVDSVEAVALTTVLGRLKAFDKERLQRCD
jgi:succinylglutamate desuccinylase